MKRVAMYVCIVLLMSTSVCYSLPGLSAVSGYNDSVDARKWKITAYCGCPKCCGKWSDGHFASGRKVYVGGVACNWLPFGSQVEIQGLGTYTVEDRGARSHFGSKNNHIRHLDVYFDKHEDAKQFGVKYRRVTITRKE